MKIEWNKVTWYSKLLAVILFVLTFYIGFGLGKESSSNPGFVSVPVAVNKPVNVVSYSCAGNKTISAAFYQGATKPAPSPDQPPIPGGSVALQFSDGRSLFLPQTISADGGRYANADESIVFWSKGDTAFVTEGDPNNETYKDCIVTP
jgi:hypothetical protein